MMAGFAVDISNFFLAHQRLKKAADAGALAGAMLLKQGGYASDFIETQAQGLAVFNFQETNLWKNASYNVTVSSEGGNYGARVNAQADMMTLFFRLIMLDKMTVQTVAQATSSDTQSAKLVI
jgi:Flp pilus assembly protein TadG